MNEAETRAEHIDPALAAAAGGRRGGPPHPQDGRDRGDDALTEGVAQARNVAGKLALRYT